MLGNYDLVAGVGFEVVNQIAAGLYDSYIIPHDFGIPSALLGNVKAGLTGVPHDAVLGRFRVREAPVFEEVAKTRYVTVHIPFAIDFLKSAADPHPTTLSGILYFAAICGALAEAGAVVFRMSAPPMTPPADLPASSLAVNAESGVQAISEQASSTLATLLSKKFAELLVESIVVSPVVHVPKLGAEENARIDVVTSTPHSGAVGPVPAILAGVQVPGKGKAPVDPTALLALKTTYTADLYVWINTATVHTAAYKARLQATAGKALLSPAPISRTELLPAVSQLITNDADSVFTATVYVKLNQDEKDRFVYARFLSKPTGFFEPKPLRGATVQLCDLDAPAPVNDDTELPETGTKTVQTGKFLKTTTTTFQPPSANQVLGTAETNFDGRVVFALQPGAGSYAGEVLVETDVKEPGGAPVESFRQSTVTEGLPDLFFAVNGPPNIYGDTLKLPNGLFANYPERRLGTPKNPVTYVFTYELSSEQNLGSGTAEQEAAQLRA